MLVGQATARAQFATRGLAGNAGRVIAFAVLLAIAAQVRFYPPGNLVPVTLQTAAVLLCGFWLRPRLAAAAVALYLGAGFAAALVAPGLALFAAFALGKTVTLGYLVGFLAAAVVVSTLSGQFARLGLGRALAVGLLGTAVIFGFGVCWLAVITGSMVAAIQQGLAPFAGWALVKTGLIAALASAWTPRR